MEDRHYTNKEFKQIMDRALRIQGQSDSSAEQGHSMSELVAIGRDLGIDEQAIREAAGDVALRGGGGMGARLAGGELVQREQVDVSHEMSREEAEEVASEIRHIVGLPGSDSVTGRRVTWQTNYLVAQQRAWTLSVSVAAHGGRTRVEVEGH
ncbi:MAG TPA: hypothetical protein VKA06_04185, partial [Spirochaetia bacterium]|nr:hypothetical protein [Spirochaetia bacterium]